ncbi:C39 family peptidase [Pseudohaliea rubra]|uniref:Putative bacteriocin resistance protein n=1 Tax=Pseudohaliea rubra DSM 19751 TaxID=1265313 RepID=A0A095X2M1_9GAMM|nr:cysteine peptidase family C39 domain-containing protein [Pseudohaliea rubra]KGE05094.1 putative bacteriocin resistance protein [Pseudohaliea rubra DSM 19751]
MRDKGLIKQQRDYSCGLAALATVLTHYFLTPTSEEALLEALASNGEREARWIEEGVSLAALARLARDRGFAAAGVAVAPGALDRLGVPAIAYLELGEDAHFTVLRGVAAEAVELADPSWGNTRMVRATFEAAFLREDGRGRLLVLAGTPGKPVAADYFGLRRPLPLLRPPR